MSYTIISRDEFIKLYRFGSIKINSNYLLDDNENIETRLIKLFEILPLEYEESYLILKIDDMVNKYYDFEKIQTIYTLNIEKIKAVYVLSSEAQHFYKTKVNQKVNFQITPFKTILTQVIELKKNQDIDEGIKILSKQFQFINKKDIERKLDNRFRDKFLKLKDYLSKDFENFYFDLLSYKRENYFPKDDIGFIYDLMIITTLQKRKTETITKFKQGELKLDKSLAYQKLNNNKKETLFENIEFILTTDDKAIKKFINNIDTTPLISGAIFLKIKYLLKEDNRDKNTWPEILKIVDSFSNKYKDELSIALYLIGLFYGYQNLYNYYYNFLKLDMFKDSENTSVEVIEKKEENLTDKKFKALKEENKKLILELEKIKELSNKSTIQNNRDIVEVKEEVVIEKREVINEIKMEKYQLNTLTNKEIIIFSRSHLIKIAKDRGVETPNSKKLYPKGDEGQINLYNAILKKTSFIKSTD
jgi:hypothetical protein